MIANPRRLATTRRGDVGFDVKYGVTQNLTADFTYNTDFAQVEADEQQVNLTRFSLFFPEKREFFLENQGTFAFGGAAAAASTPADDAPILFYSRRIGLNGGRVVPIEAGGRLTGRVGRYSVGVLNIQTGEEDARRRRSPPTSRSSRVKRDILRRSSIGVIVTGRSVAQAGTGAQPGVRRRRHVRVLRQPGVNTYWARTQTDGADRTATTPAIARSSTTPAIATACSSSGSASATTSIPEVGFVRRDDMRADFGAVPLQSAAAGERSAIRKYS